MITSKCKEYTLKIKDLITPPSEARGVLKKSAKILTVKANAVKTKIITQFCKKTL